MTAPTSPGVVPADDVRELVERLHNPMWSHSAGREPILDEEHTIADLSAAADMLKRLANRPSITEAEREQVRREAAEGERDRLFALLQDHSHNVGPYPIGLMVRDDPDLSSRWLARRRALADRSEPRQEMDT